MVFSRGSCGFDRECAFHPVTDANACSCPVRSRVVMGPHTCGRPSAFRSQKREREEDKKKPQCVFWQKKFTRQQLSLEMHTAARLPQPARGGPHLITMRNAGGSCCSYDSHHCRSLPALRACLSPPSPRRRSSLSSLLRSRPQHATRCPLTPQRQHGGPRRHRRRRGRRLHLILLQLARRYDPQFTYLHFRQPCMQT